MKASLVAVFSFGVVFIITLLVLAITFPNPTAFQYTVFRIVLALAAAGIAALIPGFLELNINTWLKAGGGMAVFAIVYFYSPAQLVAIPDPKAEMSVDRFNVEMWRLSRKLSLVAVARGEGGAEGAVLRSYGQCRAFANELGIQLPALHENTGEQAADRARALSYLLNDAGVFLAEHARRRHGASSSALVNLAVKSIASLSMYSSDTTDMNESLYKAIESAAAGSGLPDDLFEPVLDSIRQQLSFDTVKHRILDMHENVEKYLLAKAEP